MNVWRQMRSSHEVHLEYQSGTFVAPLMLRCVTC